MKDIKSAVKSRLPSTWASEHNKENIANASAAPVHASPKKPPQKQSRKISLKKVESSSDLQSFDCASPGEVLIIGQRRMFFVIKNSDAEDTGTIGWIQQYSDIASCTITFDTKTVGGTRPSKPLHSVLLA